MKIKMQNWNLLLFIFYLVFLAVGICSVAVLRPVGGSVWRLVSGQYNNQEAKSTIESAVTDELTYHDAMINLNGFKEKLFGTRVILKDDAMIVKSDSGSLVDVEEIIEEADLLSSAKLIKQLQLVSELYEAKFLYCAAPRKVFFEKVPGNVPNHSFENYNTFLAQLNKLNVPCINLTETLKNSDYTASELFYYTDHHWTTRAGFLAAEAICEALSEHNRFDYCEQYYDLNQYDKMTYYDWFLGSWGKKVGAFFSSHGADDFELILPKFPTDLTVEQPFKKDVREGCFENTILYMEYLKKDYYRINTYATYSGGDFRLQIIRNNLNREGAKIVVVRDSFACVVTPFLALHVGELHVCDVRDGDFYIGDKLDMEKYIERVRPDYVLVLYTGVDLPSSSRYDFFQER